MPVNFLQSNKLRTPSMFWILGWMLISALILPTQAFAQTNTGAATQPAETKTEQKTVPADTAKAPTQQPFGLDSLTMTGDWFGIGPKMREVGVNARFFWNTQYFSVMGGGLETGSKFSSTYDAILTFDLGKMGLIPDADMLVHGRQQWGKSVNPWTGASQQVNDDADGDRSLYVDQLWYRQHFLDRKIALQFGYLDYQTIVDRNVYANSEDKQFMNSALDNNPLFPTASATGLGAALYVKPCEWYTMILGAGDAERLPLYKPGFSTAFHDRALFLGYLENDFHMKIPTEKGDLPGNYRFGLVYDPLVRDRFVDPRKAPDQRGDDYGFYMSHDQMVYRENDTDKQGLGAFFRYAYRHSDTHRFSQFWSIGTSYTGLVPKRDADTLGFAFAQMKDSPAFRRWRNPDSGNENYYELYYAIQITPWFVLTPDIQYIDNPGGDEAVSHAIAGGLKARVTF